MKKQFAEFNHLNQLVVGASMVLLSCQSVLAEQRPVLLPSVYKMAVSEATHKIKGIVVDQTGEPIIGANVVVKGSSVGTITGIDGDFTLDVSPNSILKISYIGFVDQELPVKNKSELKVVLKEDNQQLEEVVVVGYGSQKKVNLTGSVGSIDSKVLESRPIMSSSSALQGTIPNLQVTSGSGEPGSGASRNGRLELGAR